jgi:RNA polymerase sigma factor for flagellar operon FliA
MYANAETTAERASVTRFAPLVKRIAHNMKTRLPVSIELDDLVQAGMLGLLDASDRYESDLGAQFETYAGHRIRGAILDELRKADWAPRSLRRHMRSIDAAVTAIEHNLGGTASERHIADHLNLPLAKYQSLVRDAQGAQLVYYEDFQKDSQDHFLDRNRSDCAEHPLDDLIRDELRSRIAEAVDQLPEREKAVLAMHYEESMTLREIGKVLKVSESRVCQIHAKAINRVRTRLTNQ